MKHLRFAMLCLAVLMAAASSFSADKAKPAKGPLIPMIPGQPGRPYEVVGNTLGTFEVIYKVTFTKGVGGAVSYQEALLNGFDMIREDAKRQGADAVIDTQIEYIPFPDGVIKDEQELRGQRVIGLIRIFGTCVKFKAPVAVADGAK